MARLLRVTLCLTSLLASSIAGEDGRWVWGSSGRSFVSDRDPYYNRDRYPPVTGSYRPPPPIYEPEPGPDPSRPPPPPPPPPPPYGRPDFRPRPPGGPPPPPPGTPVLTGPVPSWEQRPTPPGGFKSYDRCKCAHSFNCNSPGIVFGSCDAGKQYCCYDLKPQGEGFGIDRPYGGGGEGPVTFGGRPDGRRDIPEVLVGPGGPTGIIGGRPRPEYYDDDDYDGFGRSAKKDKKL
ncbi:basic salivary proline-rich protein 2-like [Schistocerca serialis cubense]|uniref:basic salivary proline-rich protein 2-like n=1 Tax=Schistocerca serialis cubense TaxID=2023355 RepID=UPI00214E7A0A|nr:basic salivary proline-rich protein 2-like [Schistocerca serialis cubense]